MSVEEKKRLLALHRLQQASESLQEARYLLAGGKSLLDHHAGLSRAAPEEEGKR